MRFPVALEDEAAMKPASIWAGPTFDVVGKAVERSLAFGRPDEERIAVLG